MRVYKTACITFRTKCQSTVVQSISSSSIAGPGVPSDQRTCPQTKLWTSAAVASSSTRGTSPLMPIIHWVTRRVASVIVCSLRDIATIHSDGMSGDKRGSIGAEPDHGFSNFFRLAHSSHRMTDDDLLFHLGSAQQRLIDQGGPNIARTHRIDPDTRSGILQRRGFRQAHHPVLARIICRGPTP